MRLGVYQRTLEQFPKIQGIIWGNSVMYEVFEVEGYKINVKGFPVKRMPIALEQNQVDIFWSSWEELRSTTDDLLHSDFPIVLAPYWIYYDNSSGWKPSWPPNEDFKRKRGTSTQSSKSLQKMFGLNIKQTASFKANIKMVNVGRADYHIDNAGGFARLPGGQRNRVEDGFITEHLYNRRLYAWVQDTAKGRELLEIFNRGHLKILREGRLAKVYYRNHKTRVDPAWIIDTVSFINNENPELLIPVQEQ